MLKYLTEEILKLYTTEVNYYNDRTYYITTQTEKLNSFVLDESKNLILFFPSLLNKSDYDQLSSLILNETTIKMLKKKQVYILCLYTSVEVADTLFTVADKNELTLKITTLYYSNDIVKYESLLRTGVSNVNVEYFTSDNFVLSSENYCDYFKLIVRRYFN